MIRRGAVLERRLLDGVLLMHARGSFEPIRLNGTAASIWYATADPGDEAEIVQRVAAVYGADPNDIEVSVRAALAELCADGVLVDD